MIVADANLIVYLFLPGEHSEAAEEVLERDAEWCAPLLWRSEIRNVLAVYRRKGMLDAGTAVRAFDRAGELIGGREYSVETRTVIRLADQSSCSAYDCEYVSLARTLQVSLVTSDAEILRAFPDTTVDMENFGADPPPQ